MFDRLKQQLKTLEGFFVISSIALVFAMFALFAVGVNAFSKVGNPNDYAVISVTGEGESFAIPDIAKFTFTIQQEAKTMDDAQKAVTVQADGLLQQLKDLGIAEKDIKTEGFNAYPKYETKSRSIMPCGPDYCPPYNPGNPVIVGYTVSHSYSVKVRDLEQAGAVAETITAANVYSLNGPDFTIDDQKTIENQARAKAIADAKAQAKILSRQLGVRLGKIIDFQVTGNGGPVYPMYYAKSEMAMDSAGAASAPSIEPGETQVKSVVTITYRIR